MILAWHDGAAHHLTPREWAEVCASFLGAGFRVDLPGGRARSEASHYELDRVRQIGELIGAAVPASGWDRAAAFDADVDVEVIGGWPRTYSGESAMWIATLAAIDHGAVTTGALLPSPWRRRPTGGLPMFSRLADDVALAGVEADCGLWADTDGRVVTSTAGPILAQRVDGSWATGTDSSTWLAHRVAAERGATPDLCVEDLQAARFVGVVWRAHEIQSLTYVS